MQQTHSKILSQDMLLKALEQRRLEGNRVVVTNGCFDILHVGHLRYLQAAKAVGDILVLLLNSDASVRYLKGTKRPVTPEDERAEILAALTCIDYVTIFDEQSPVSLLEKIRPELYVKGGDYDLTNLPEAPILQSIGTEVKFVPIIQGHSTSSFIQRIIDAYQSTNATY